MKGFISILLLMQLFASSIVYAQVTPRHKVNVNQVHQGTLTIDTMLLNSYSKMPQNIVDYYLETRSIFSQEQVDFTNEGIVNSAKANELSLMAGPMLGDLKSDGLSIWLRTANTRKLSVQLTSSTNKKLTYSFKPEAAGLDQRIVIDGLQANTFYQYKIIQRNKTLAQGTFTTAPKDDDKSTVRIAFGSCFHKRGIHNPNIFNAILMREPNAMMLLGDIAVDDRNANVSLHRTDYLLRDMSQPWQKLTAHIPLYTSWDDHDYRDNDLSGISRNFTTEDRDNLRKLWRQNWNNPTNEGEGIYFNTRIGEVELIMLDTRSCRKPKERGKYASYLGKAQQEWLKATLKNSDATFKIISSGTMWSDYMTKAKDSWGTWDKTAREEIFSFIEDENISGVLLISGDRHGARGFTIPRSSGKSFYEFEAATLGGVPGPPAMASDSSNQLFGYKGAGFIAFGEFTFEMEGEPRVTFRLINENGEVMEEYGLKLEDLL